MQQPAPRFFTSGKLYKLKTSLPEILESKLAKQLVRWSMKDEKKTMQRQSSILLVFCLVSGCLSKSPPTFVEYKDSIGQYSFGYSAPGSARSEVRSLDGTTRGSYSYVDDAGVIQSAQYTADGERGFQIVATNLPQAPKPVKETPEVVAARLNHLKAIEEAKKLAEPNPEIEVQPVIALSDGKAVDTVVIENASDSADDKMANQILAKDVNSEVKAELQSEGKDAVTRVTARIGIAEGAGESGQISENSDKVESAPIASLPRAADSSVPNIPVVTTSFVIPGRVNLHSRVELDQSGVAAARFSPEPSTARLGTVQSSIPQGQAVSFDPSAITPAGTRMSPIAGSEMSGMIGIASPISAASVGTTTSSGNAQAYSATLVPGVRILPSTSYQYLTYGIGIDPFYQHYNPYRYFRYGIL